jgi:glutamine cyclotransferase
MAGPGFYRVRVLARLPHLGRGFTQGLIADGDSVWESTGLYGESLLRRCRPGADRDDGCGLVPPELWAEGCLLILRGKTYWEAWQEKAA